MLVLLQRELEEQAVIKGAKALLLLLIDRKRIARRVVLLRREIVFGVDLFNFILIVVFPEDLHTYFLIQIRIGEVLLMLLLALKLSSALQHVIIVQYELIILW